MSDDGGSSNGDSADKGTTHVLEIIGNAIVGGMENYVANLISQLPSDQFRVSCLCPFESAFTVSLRRMGCTVFITPLRDDPPWRSVQMAVELIRQHHVDLIHAHLPNAHVLAGLAGCLTHTPAAATIHGMNLTTQELGISRMTQTHLVVVCQEAYAQALALGVLPEHLTLIPNGVDIRIFTPDRGGEMFRMALGVPLDAPLVGFVGRLAWEKGPDEFVRVAERVHRQCPEAHFAIVGEGPMEGQLTTTIRQLGLNPFVHMAGLWTNIWEVYPAFDVFVQTSRSEGMPLAVLEAMACGRTVVAIAVGGVAEIVEAGTSGLLVSPGDWGGTANAYSGGWEGVAKTLIDLLPCQDRLAQMGKAGRRRVEDLFSLQNSVRFTGDLFHRLANRKLLPLGVWQAMWSTARAE
jgi:glycosyltransferase involved in cell wall biosynthesis